MAEALVSGLASTIVGNLNSLVLQELGIVSLVKDELEDLRSTFTAIQAVLRDAEEKQWKSEAVKDWLGKLKAAAYEVEDVLDEFTIEAQRRQQQRKMKDRVRSFFSPNFQPKMAHKLKKLKRNLHVISKERHDFHLHLREGVGEIEADSFDHRQTWSLMPELEIYGRGKEKEDLINMLLTSRDDFSIYAICGMGGLGKTTLAQLVYNDGSIKQHFDLQIWVCVSVDFNIKRLTRAIIESIERTSPNIQELETHKQCLQEKLSGKKFLLVLDDVWDDNNGDWNRMKDAMNCGAKGSAVIVTTRLGTIADKMATTPVQHMETLSDDDSWLLFKQIAFGLRRREEYAHLEKIGVAIVKKCGGVPLAIRALGSLMCSKKFESQWLSVKESELWDLPREGSHILPALSLSYTNLKPHLKQCFAFCSIFPKDYVMQKDRLVALWLANGFISCKRQTDLHEMGEEIFNELVGRSFFQEVKDDGLGNITCKMHDLVHDLAQSVMKHECCSIEDNTEMKISETIRHLALCGRSELALNDRDLKAWRLHTLLLLSDPPYKFGSRNWSEGHGVYFSRQKHLRALEISRYNMSKLPKSFCNLKHLSFLYISECNIKTLPESTTSLKNLQTLSLRYCCSLFQLPKGIKQLKNLMYLDVKGCTSLHSLPAGIGQLTCLRRLRMFIVGKDDGCLIRELERLNYLGSELRIIDLGNVKNLTDAKSANLMGKTDLQSLTLSWHGNGFYLVDLGEATSCSGICKEGSVVRENIEEVLDGLQPHSNLKKLRIYGYGGSNFPNWMMNMNLMLPNLVEILLEWCGNSEQLPPFGKLHFLKRLKLHRMDGVKCIGSDVYGDEENPFPSLETLRLSSMNSLEQWVTVAGRVGFPCLNKATVVDCHLLMDMPIIPSVKTLVIHGGSVTLLRSVRNSTSLTSLYITSFTSLKLLPDGLLQNHTLLERLHISSLKNLCSLSNQILDNLSALKSLRISYCDELESLPEEVRGLSSLKDFELYGCPKLSSLPESIQHLTSLRSLSITTCVGLSSLPSQIGYLTSISRLCIAQCPGLMSLPNEIQNLNMLTELIIVGCPNLERRCEKEIGEDWPKIAHIANIQIC